MARTDTLSGMAHNVPVRFTLPLGLALLLGLSGCTTPGNQSRRLTVWIVGDTRDLRADSDPLLENEVYSASRGIMELTAAINETIAVQVGLKASDLPAGPFDIRISDLNSSGGATLAALKNIAFFNVHDTHVEHYDSWFPERTGRNTSPADYPDILVPWNAPQGGGPIRLDRRRTQSIWIDLHVPTTTNPGVYTGKLELINVADKKVTYSCLVSLTVVPIAIPSDPALPLLCRVDPRQLLVRHLNWPLLPAEETRILPDVSSHQPAKQLVDTTMRLLHEHRVTPLLWAGFPKYRLTDERSLTIDWEAYDSLVGGWLNGDEFPDHVGLSRWLIPASSQYPNAERNGGFGSARYARLLAAYLAECRKHFAERGWLDRSFLRLTPPGDVSQELIDRVRRTLGIMRQSETHLPFVAHLPVQSLRALGWYNAPTIDLPEVDIWAPPARWFEPELLERQRGLGKRVWFIPDLPPYSPSLKVEAPATDPRIIAWQAYRYGTDAVWIEDACGSTTLSASSTSYAGDPLIYTGVDYGLLDQPVPSIRLKRLRRGLYDYELLSLLQRRGKPLLASRTVDQLVRWAFTDACEVNLLSTRVAGWPTEAYPLWLARRVMIQELVNEFTPSQAGHAQQSNNLANWAGVMNQSSQVRAEVRGVRLNEHNLARVHLSLSNETTQTLTGTWRFPALPVGWTLPAVAPTNIGPGRRVATTLDLNLESLTYNLNGVYPFQVQFDTQTAGAFAAAGRLAVATCPLIQQAPRIDGNLSDWMLASSNVAGNFQLVRGRGPRDTRQPTLATQAFFCMDYENLYVAVRCSVKPGEPPLWNATNAIPVDGAIPWGQDVVEILIDPYNTQLGTGENIYCLQIKPSGLLVARQGCLTNPPMNRGQPWQSGARVAVTVSDREWIVETALPLAALGRVAQRNRVWGCNITRLDARRGEYSSWSGARGYTYAPHLLGNLVPLRP